MAVTIRRVAVCCAWMAATGPVAAAVLSGSVVENGTARALARAKVTLEARQTSEATGSLTVLTGIGGQFTFDGLPSGVYLLRVEREGYATARYGQRRYEEPGTPIILETDSHFVAELRLKRFGAVTGEIVDENQVGLPDVPVHAYELGTTLKVTAVAKTDDRGVYRLAGLKPGRYLIRTAARRLEGGHELLPTYYPQATSAGDAENVHVALDQEVAGIDIAPAPGRLSAVNGTVVGGGAASVIMLTGTGPRTARIRPGGGFRFEQIEPGSYALLVDPAPGSERAAYGEVFVGDQEARVVLEMLPAPRLRIRCEETTAKVIDSSSVSIFLSRKELGGASTRVNCGERTVRGPGRWQMAVATPPQFYVASIVDDGGGEDAHNFTLKPGQSREITVLLSSHPAELRGKVLTDDGQPALGAPVFLDAYDSELRRRLGGVRTTRADQNGEYWFAGLPPGPYRILSSFQVRNPGQIGSWVGLGASVRLEKDAKVMLDVSLTETVQ